eukprot:9169961-Alexandrium_andersonii.AAC.1
MSYRWPPTFPPFPKRPRQARIWLIPRPSLLIRMLCPCVSRSIEISWNPQRGARCTTSSTEMSFSTSPTE